MPGIAGLITRMPRQRAESQLLRMLKVLRHESSYVTGTRIDESLGVYLGWVARRESFADGMPLSNESGSVVLAFSGEDYSDAGTADRLKANGDAVAGVGRSYLVRLYEEDPAFPAGLNGRFHGLLADRSRERALLFNDRYGMHRIYYSDSTDAFYFAPEAKAILAVRPELRRLDPRGFGEFLACGCVLENRTLFRGIQVLPPGSIWTFCKGVAGAKRTYFDPREWEGQEALAPDDWYEELRRAFSGSLPRYFSGSGRIGMSLTGGLDGRMIMAWHRPAPGSLPCYTFGGTYRDCRDVVVARRVARACGQPHHVINVGGDFVRRFPIYAERTVHLTDGCADVSRSPDLWVNEQAREIAPVRMTGNYGSEVLRANRAFKPGKPASGLFSNELLPYVEEASRTYSGLLNCHPVSFAVFRQAPWHHYGLQALEETQLCLRSPYLDNDLVRTAFRAPASSLITPDACLRLIADGDPALRRIRADRGLADGHNPLTSKMARALLEFTFKAEYAYDYGMPQWIARIDHILSPFHVERLFLGRHKFYHFRVWYRDLLSGYVREMLLDSRTLSRPYLERRAVEQIVGAHLAGTRNYTTEIHKLLTLELIHRLFLDRSESCEQQEADEKRQAALASFGARSFCPPIETTPSTP